MSDLLLFSILSTQTCSSYLGSVKYTYISIVKQIITT